LEITLSTTLDLTAANAILKELYTNQVVTNMVYTDNPTLALLKKNTDFGGKYKPIPIQYGVSQGRSATFATAQANQSAARLQEFLLTRKRDYSIATIDNETLLAAATDTMSFIRTGKLLVDSAIQSAVNSICSGLFRSGTGSIGQIGSISSGIITLANIGDVVGFEVDMVIQANATDGGTPRAALGYVISVDRTLGTVTVSATSGGAAGSPAAWAPNDYLLVQGDNNAKLSGFEAWIPSSAPSSTPFYGVDRSVDTRLGGLRFDGTNQSIEEALLDAASLTAREGGKPDYFITNFTSYAGLEKSLGSKVQYIEHRMGEIGFRGIAINGPNRVIKVFPDRSCPSLKGYLLQMDTWALESLGEAPQILRYGSGDDMLRVYNADSAELRVAFYGNMSNSAPGFNCNVTLSS
jgi:hypothetical protein